MEQLFKDFPPAGAAAWKARLEKDLKGITFEQLSVTDRNGITIHPFYTAEDIAGTPASLSLQKDWSICAELTVTDARQANLQALAELNNGASGLTFLINTDTDPAVLLQDIELPYIYSSFSVAHKALPFIGKLEQYLKEKGWQQAQMDCFTGFDFIGSYLRPGAWEGDKGQIQDSFRSAVTTYGISGLYVDASLYHNAGATSAYELACTMAHINEYMHLLKEKEKLSAVTRVQVTLATDTAFFEQIAKLRAFRKLAALLFKTYDINPAVHLHGTTSAVYRAPFDSYSNLLRDTIAGMAAVTGGCDSLYIRPFDESLKTPGDFSLRMARNQQLIFKEESYLHKVADVSAGSYYLETLTEQIAAKAWETFKAIESQGGLLASFENGKLEAAIGQQADQLIKDYKEGKRVLIGVNKFPNPKDAPAAGVPETIKTKGLHPLRLAEAIL